MASLSPPLQPPTCLIIPQLEPYHSSSAAATFSEFAAARTLAQLSAVAPRTVSADPDQQDLGPEQDQALVHHASGSVAVASSPSSGSSQQAAAAHTKASSASASGASTGSSNSGPRRKRRRPPKSYVVLIAEAILNSPVKCLSIREIYAAIAAAYPTHYADPVDLGWQNTVRYNLSRHPAFVKVPHPPKYIGPTTSNRSSFWTISPEFLAQFERGNFVSAESLDPAGYPAHAASAKKLADSDGARQESSPVSPRRKRTTSMCHQPAVPLPLPLSPVASPHTPVLAPVKTSSALGQSVPSLAPVHHRHHHPVPTPLLPMPVDLYQQLGSLPTPTLSPSIHAFARSTTGPSSSSLFFPLRSPNAHGFQGFPTQHGAHTHHYHNQHIVSPLLMPSPASSATTSDRHGRSATRELSPAVEGPSSPLSPSQGGSVHKMSLSFLLSA